MRTFFSGNTGSSPLDPIQQFQQEFTQPFPLYGSKGSHGWRQVPRVLKYEVCHDHLNGQRIIGTLGRWYPKYGILDIDDKPFDQVLRICAHIGFSTTNSLIFTSESANSYHVYFKPMKDGKLVTLNYFKACFELLEQTQNLEFYPKAFRVVRLPFSRGISCVNAAGVLENISYEQGLQALERLQEFDLTSLPHAPEHLFSLPHTQLFQAKDLCFGNMQGWMAQGLTYWNEGLQQSGTRLEATKRVIYFFWRNNVPLMETIHYTKEWLKKKHHGFSKDYLQHRNTVYKQIEEITVWIYDHFMQSYTLPDSAHLLDKGFMSPSVLENAVIITRGNLPRLRFLTHLMGYYAPRQQRELVSVHSNRLREWSSATNANKFLLELQTQGILERQNAYRVDHFAKKIKLLIPASQPHEMLLQGDRPAETLEELIPLAFNPEKYKSLLTSLGVKPATMQKQLSILYAQAPIKPATRTSVAEQRKAAVLLYKKQHPASSNREIAAHFGYDEKTIRNYSKGAEL